MNFNFKHLHTSLSYKTFLILVFFCFTNVLKSQEKIGPDTYLIWFTDKYSNTYSLQNPQQFLSNKALERRTKQRIDIETNDLPVSVIYIDSIKSIGAEVLNISKWFNAISIKITDLSILQQINQLGFVKPYKSISQINNSFNLLPLIKNRDVTSNTKSLADDYGNSLTQLSIHHGDYLHSIGFKGQGITIAVFDGGFQDVKNFTSLQNLWFEQRVLSLRDFADKSGYTFFDNLHGSNVLSVLAGVTHGSLIGSAPQANYILLHTENSSIDKDGKQFEYPVEEFDWVVAAEYADSIGADIISSSLGYTTFNDPSMNYTYESMDGKTAISSIGANIAASKGILIVTSAGNEGNTYWKYISAPADAENIISVGAIDLNGVPANFSSKGPTKDGRIKPDVVAIGKNTLVQVTQNTFNLANGTSFSAPIISGLAACLWQAVPNASNMDIIEAIKQSASQASNPDTILGYGIPDFKKALYLLKPDFFNTQGEFSCYPNPFTSNLTIETGPLSSGTAHISIVNTIGQRIFESEFNVITTYPNTINLTELNNFKKGIYILTFTSGNISFKTSIIKL